MAASAPTREQFHPGDAWLIGVVLAVLTFWLFAQTLLNVIPSIRTGLGLSDSIASLAVSITALMAGIFIVVAGGIGDRFGHAMIFRLGILASILGSLLLILTPADAGGATTAMMLSGRVIQGISTAMIMPSSLAMINYFFRAEQRQRAVSFFSLGTFGGLGVASLAGGLIAGLLGWRSIFVVSILVAVLALWLTRNTPAVRIPAPAGGRRPFDVAGLIVFLVAIVGLNVYISQGRTLGWVSGAGLALIALTLIAFAAFIALELRKGRGAFIDLRMFRSGRFTGPVLANFLMNSTAAVIIVTLGLVQSGAGWTPLRAGLLTIGHLLAVVLSIRIGERMLQRVGAKRPMLLGVVSNLIGVSLVACTFLPLPVYLVFAVLGLALFGLGQGLFATPAIDANITSVDPDEVGVASGILKMGSTLGQGLGVALATTFVAIGAAMSSDRPAGWAPGGWLADSGPARVGGTFGAGLLVVIAIGMIITVLTLVPGASRRPSPAADAVAD